MKVEKKFECNSQGCCCKNLSGRYTAENKEQVKKFNEFGPIYFLVDPDKVTIPISCFEILPLVNIAKEKGIEFNPQPCNVLIDDKKKKVLVLTYDLGYDTCPFLNKDNLCSIYGDRPLLCRTYPFRKEQRGQVMEYSADNCPCVDRDYFSKCVNGEDDSLGVGDIQKNVMNYFGKEEYAYATIQEILNNMQSKAMKFFFDNKKNPYFNPVRKPLRFIERKFDSFEFVPLNVFFNNSGIELDEIKALSLIADGKFFENLKNKIVDEFD